MRSTLWFRSVLCLASASFAVGLTGVTYSALHLGLRMSDDMSDVAAVVIGLLVLAVTNAVIWSRWRVRLPSSFGWLGTGAKAGLAAGLFVLCGVLYWVYETTAGPLLVGGDMEPEFVSVCGGLILAGGFIAGLAFFGLVPAPRKPPERVVLCPECGYNMTGLHEARCPECGARYTLDELLAATSRKA